jgi:hypothetical protein
MKKTRVWPIVALPVVVLLGCGGDTGSNAGTDPTGAVTAGSEGGTGFSGSAVAGLLALDPPNGNFGTVGIGTRQSIVFTVTNYTEGRFSARISGPDASQFRLGGGTCFAATRGGTDAPASPCTLQIIMIATSTGPKMADLTVGANTTASLTGTGVAN